MANGTCSVEGCDKQRTGRYRLCSMHRSRQYRTGSTDPGPLARPKVVRFWEKVEKGQADQCWPWIAGLASTGYGAFDGGYAHRFAWELHTGEKIPKGMHVDHKCFNRACVNPHHLQVVTLTENNQNHNGARRNSQTGIRGVTWCKAMKKWQAIVEHDGVVHRRYFEDIDVAAAAVVEMRNQLHTNNLLDRQSA